MMIVVVIGFKTGEEGREREEGIKINGLKF